MQEDKVAEVERELNEAQYRVESAQATYDTIVSRMAVELARFQVRHRQPTPPGICVGCSPVPLGADHRRCAACWP